MFRTRSTPARRRLVGGALTAALAFLIACSTPATVVDPAIGIELDTAAAEVIRGGTLELVVTLTRVGGAADTVALTVDGLPANVSASFSPASLDGGSLTSTLTIAAAPNAAEGVSTLTVTGTGGGLTDDAELSLEVTSLSVSGTVNGIRHQPLVGVTVESQGQTTFSGTGGAFTLDGLSIPYDLRLSGGGGGGGVHVFEGMTTPTPSVTPGFAINNPPLFAFGTTIGGTVLGGDPVVAGNAILVCVEGIDVVAYGCTDVQPGETSYTLDITWPNSSDQLVRIHAVHSTYDGDVPTAYLGYATAELDVGHSILATADLTFGVVASVIVEGTVATTGGMAPSGALGWLRFGPNLTMPITQTAPAQDFAMLMPVIPGVAYDLFAGGSGSDGVGVVWRRVTGDQAGTFDVPEPGQLTSPPDSAVDVDLTTMFAVTGGATVRTFTWIPDAGGPLISLTTTRLDVTMPNPNPPYAFPAGANYDWDVFAHVATTVDEAASSGISVVDASTMLLDGKGGPGLDESGALARTNSNALTFALP